MVEGPIIPKRTGGPPSDLPDKQLSYPGKPLSHRYLPTEKVRIVEEVKGTDQSRLASDTPFTPIASVRYPEKNIHLGPVTNVRTRAIQPVATSGSVTLPVNGSSIYEISEDLRKPLEARMRRLTTQTTPAAVVVQEHQPEVPETTQPPSNQEATTASKEVATELQKLKETGAKELEKRRSSVESSQSQLPLSQSTQPATVVGEHPTPTTTIPLSPSPVADEGTKKLLEQAKQLETELSQLRKGLVTKRDESVAESQKTKAEIERQGAQVQHLTADRSYFSQKVADLTTTHSEEVVKRKELEYQIENLKIDYDQKLKQLIDERDQLITNRETLTQKVTDLTESHAKELNARKELETKLDKLVGDYEAQLKAVIEERDKLTASKSVDSAQYQSLEARVGNMTREFDQKLQSIQIEKTNLLDQVKKLQVGQEATKQKDIQIGNLQKKATQFEEEKAQSTKRYEKLEALVADLGHKPTAKPVGLATAEPKPSFRAQAEGKEAPKPELEMSPKAARVVAPQPAVGKMAPSLTSAPNVINGILKDAGGLLLSSVIIVVKDDTGQPVRALKSNKIGRFAISTPLPNGTYTMELESSNHNFDIIQVEMKGKVLPPIEIKALN